MVAAFMDEIDGVQIHLSRLDYLTWRADPSGSYSTKSAYNLFMDDGSSDNEDSASRIMWNLKIPPRASAFSWRIFKNRLPTKANLRRRQVALPSYTCPLCDVEEESVGHVMFSCTRTRSLWWEVLRWVDRVDPFPIDPKNHFIQFSHWNSKRYIDKRWAVLWIALSMTIWKHRNSVVFNNQIFNPEKVMDEALFHTWSWLK
ncbi:putative ribonuclease H protein [Glycine soja]